MKQGEFNGEGSTIQRQEEGNKDYKGLRAPGPAREPASTSSTQALGAIFCISATSFNKIFPIHALLID